MSPDPTPRGAYPGHAVLQLPVTALDPWVRERSAHYDTAYVSDDPAFVHAHVTALGPIPDVVDGLVPQTFADVVAAICADASPFTAVFADVATFPTGIVHLRPVDPTPFTALTDALREAFPDVLPYGGKFVPDPHLTLDALSDAPSMEVSEASVRESVAALLPAREHVTHLDLAWWAPQECRILARWELGTGVQRTGIQGTGRRLLG